MKTLKNIAVTIGLSVVLGSATLIAQITNDSKANIPFDFQVMGSTLPAGHYTVRLATANRMLTFRNIDTGRAAILAVQAFRSGTMEEPKLTFRYDGERYTLETAWFAGVEGGYGPLGAKRNRAESERGILATVRLLQK